VFYYVTRDEQSQVNTSMFNEQEMNIQERLWMMGVIELSMSSYEAEQLVRLLRNHMLEGIEENEKIVIHFSSSPSITSAKWKKLKVQRINQILDSSIEEPIHHTYHPDRIISARELVEYYDLTHGRFKE
jgi:hypothetical protein